MNATTNGSEGFLGSKDIGGFGYGIGVSVAILLLITSITLASYFCTRSPPPPSLRRRRRNDDVAAAGNDDVAVVIEVGLDEETIKSYPKVKFNLLAEDKSNSNTSTARCCSICLADYKAGDSLRKLPECGHLFHAGCVDTWLRLHPTCPVCRTSPAPTPLSTPLAEVVPLASRRD